MKTVEQLFKYGLVILLFLFNSCGGSGETEKKTDTQQADSSKSVQSQNTNKNVSNPGAVLKALIKDGEGEEILDIDITEKESIIKFEKGNFVLTGHHTKADKSKYYNNKGDFVAEVKYKDDGFKLRDEESKLLWKIKISPDKVKLSDNEENDSPYEIKKNDAGKYKVFAPGKQLGEAKFKDGKVTVKGSAYGVLLVHDIPEELRYVIIAELLKN